MAVNTAKAEKYTKKKKVDRWIGMGNVINQIKEHQCANTETNLNTDIMDYGVDVSSIEQEWHTCGTGDWKDYRGHERNAAEAGNSAFVDFSLIGDVKKFFSEGDKQNLGYEDSGQGETYQKY